MIRLPQKPALVFFAILLYQSAMAQPMGKIIQEKTVKSTILNRNVNYTLYLPADYEQSQRSYPVVYLLHGYTDDNTAWLQFGEVNRYADKAIADGTIPPMIIVMPDAD
jgi:enterochelin esterase-like enzyme